MAYDLKGVKLQFCMDWLLCLLIDNDTETFRSTLIPW